MKKTIYRGRHSIILCCLFLLANFTGLSDQLYSQDHGVNLILNGDFDIAIGGSDDIYLRSRQIGAWTVKREAVRVLKYGGSYLQDAAHPVNALELAAWDPGAIEQSIPTEIGVEYTLSFVYAGNFSSEPEPKGVRILIPSAGPAVDQTFTIDSKPAGWSVSNLGWKKARLNFIATQATTTIELAAAQHWTDDDAAIITNISVVATPTPPPSLSSLSVPLPSNLDSFIRNRDAAIVLGKALFWDMQVGSDGRTACATCHFGAGIDLRTKNVVHHGAPGSAFGPQRDGQIELLEGAIADFLAEGGANGEFDAAEFPHHKRLHPTRDHKDNPVVEDSKEVYGSQGVVMRDFVTIREGNPSDRGRLVPDLVFNINRASARQVTGRNSPTMINAVFFDRLFWDGRAQHHFNGVNEFGELDPTARVLKATVDSTDEPQYGWVWKSDGFSGQWEWDLTNRIIRTETLEPTKILLNNAALASQAVGPSLSDSEMSWHGRDFKSLGRKLLSVRPLRLQRIHKGDSVLGSYARPTGKGLAEGLTYEAMIRAAFKEEWWASTSITDDNHTHMEANFSLYWGLALMMYQSTLVSDQSPYDAYAEGDESALTDSQKRGLKLFLNEGKCINCHGGAEFAGATISDVRKIQESTGTTELIEFMPMEQGEAFYDGGFYNIGVRPTLEDLGVGASHPLLGPLSYSRRRQQGQDVGQSIEIKASDRIAVDGAFKSASLRNIELTGPYFHNGGQRTLEEVVNFYVRGADFHDQNIQDLDPDVSGISELQENPERIADLVNFLKSLTDDRVRFQKAPFDHPELFVPNGHLSTTRNGVARDDFIRIRHVGRNGGEEIISFEERVK